MRRLNLLLLLLFCLPLAAGNNENRVYLIHQNFLDLVSMDGLTINWLGRSEMRRLLDKLKSRFASDQVSPVMMSGVMYDADEIVISRLASGSGTADFFAYVDPTFNRIMFYDNKNKVDYKIPKFSWNPAKGFKETETHSFSFRGMWGDYGNWTGRFRKPHGIATDNSMGYWVADTWNDRVCRLEFQEATETFAWQGCVNGFYHPWDVEYRDDSIYVAEPENGRITKCQAYYTGTSSRNNCKTIYSRPGKPQESPLSVAAGALLVDASGNESREILIGVSSGRVYSALQKGSKISVADTALLDSGSTPTDVHFDDDGAMLVVDKAGQSIYKFAKGTDGRWERLYRAMQSNGLADSVPLVEPRAMSIYGTDIYVTEKYGLNSGIKRFKNYPVFLRDRMDLFRGCTGDRTVYMDLMVTAAGWADVSVSRIWNPMNPSLGKTLLKTLPRMALKVGHNIVVVDSSSRSAWNDGDFELNVKLYDKNLERKSQGVLTTSDEYAKIFSLGPPQVRAATVSVDNRYFNPNSASRVPKVNFALERDAELRLRVVEESLFDSIHPVQSAWAGSSEWTKLERESGKIHSLAVPTKGIAWKEGTAYKVLIEIRRSECSSEATYVDLQDLLGDAALFYPDWTPPSLAWSFVNPIRAFSRYTSKVPYQAERLRLENISDNLGSVSIVVDSWEDGLSIRPYCKTFLCRYQQSTGSAKFTLADTKASKDSVMLVDLVPTSAWERQAASIEVMDLAGNLVRYDADSMLFVRDERPPLVSITPSSPQVIDYLGTPAYYVGPKQSLCFDYSVRDTFPETKPASMTLRLWQTVQNATLDIKVSKDFLKGDSTAGKACVADSLFFMDGVYSIEVLATDDIGNTNEKAPMTSVVGISKVVVNAQEPVVTARLDRNYIDAGGRLNLMVSTGSFAQRSPGYVLACRADLRDGDGDTLPNGSVSTFLMDGNTAQPKIIGISDASNVPEGKVGVHLECRGSFPGVSLGNTIVRDMWFYKNRRPPSISTKDSITVVGAPFHLDGEVGDPYPGNDPVTQGFAGYEILYCQGHCAMPTSESELATWQSRTSSLPSSGFFVPPSFVDRSKAADYPLYFKAQKTTSASSILGSMSLGYVDPRKFSGSEFTVLLVARERNTALNFSTEDMALRYYRYQQASASPLSISGLSASAKTSGSVSFTTDGNDSLAMHLQLNGGDSSARYQVHLFLVPQSGDQEIIGIGSKLDVPSGSSVDYKWDGRNGYGMYVANGSYTLLALAEQTNGSGYAVAGQPGLDLRVKTPLLILDAYMTPGLGVITSPTSANPPDNVATVYFQVNKATSAWLDVLDSKGDSLFSTDMVSVSGGILAMNQISWRGEDLRGGGLVPYGDYRLRLRVKDCDSSKAFAVQLRNPNSASNSSATLAFDLPDGNLYGNYDISWSTKPEGKLWRFNALTLSPMSVHVKGSQYAYRYTLQPYSLEYTKRKEALSFQIHMNWNFDKYFKCGALGVYKTHGPYDGSGSSTKSVAVNNSTSQVTVYSDRVVNNNGSCAAGSPNFWIENAQLQSVDFRRPDGTTIFTWICSGGVCSGGDGLGILNLQNAVAKVNDDETWIEAKFGIDWNSSFLAKNNTSLGNYSGIVSGKRFYASSADTSGIALPNSSGEYHHDAIDANGTFDANVLALASGLGRNRMSLRIVPPVNGYIRFEQPSMTATVYNDGRYSASAPYILDSTNWSYGGDAANQVSQPLSFWVHTDAKDAVLIPFPFHPQTLFNSRPLGDFDWVMRAADPALVDAYYGSTATASDMFTLSLPSLVLTQSNTVSNPVVLDLRQYLQGAKDYTGRQIDWTAISNTTFTFSTGNDQTRTLESGKVQAKIVGNQLRLWRVTERQYVDEFLDWPTTANPDYFLKNSQNLLQGIVHPDSGVSTTVYSSLPQMADFSQTGFIEQSDYISMGAAYDKGHMGSGAFGAVASPSTWPALFWKNSSGVVSNHACRAPFADPDDVCGLDFTSWDSLDLNYMDGKPFDAVSASVNDDFFRLRLQPLSEVRRLVPIRMNKAIPGIKQAWLESYNPDDSSWRKVGMLSDSLSRLRKGSTFAWWDIRGSVGPTGLRLTYKDSSGNAQVVHASVPVGSWVGGYKEEMVSSPFKKAELHFPAGSSFQGHVTLDLVSPQGLSSVAGVQQGPVVRILPHGLMFAQSNRPSLTFFLTSADLAELGIPINQLGRVGVYYLNDKSGRVELAELSAQALWNTSDTGLVKVSSGPQTAMGTSQVYSISIQLEHTSLYGVGDLGSLSPAIGINVPDGIQNWATAQDTLVSLSGTMKGPVGATVRILVQNNNVRPADSLFLGVQGRFASVLSGDSSWSLSGVALPYAENWVFAAELSGGKVIAVNQVKISKDNTAPVIKSLVVTPTAIGKDQTHIRISGVVSEPGQITLYAWNFFQGDFPTFTISPEQFEAQGGGFSFTVPIDEYDGGDLPDGEQAFTVSAVDIAGNIAEPQTVRFSRDIVPPVLTVSHVSILDSATGSLSDNLGVSMVELTFQAGLEQAVRRISLEGTFVNWKALLDTSSLPEGIGSIMVRGYDLAGNMAESGPYPFVNAKGQCLGKGDRVKVEVKNTGTAEHFTQMEFRISNLTDVALGSFEMRYYIQMEDGQVPEVISSPWGLWGNYVGTMGLQMVHDGGNLWHVSAVFNGSLVSSQALAFGFNIHGEGWLASNWDATDDYSYADLRNAQDFVDAAHIPVYDGNGLLLTGAGCVEGSDESPVQVDTTEQDTTQVPAGVQVVVIGHDGNYWVQNNVVPHVYVKNAGTVALDELEIIYWINNTPGKTLVIEENYHPGSVFTKGFDAATSMHYASFKFTGINLLPGQSLNPTGYQQFMYHYSDWSVLQKTEHCSYRNMASSDGDLPWVEVRYKGKKIHGLSCGILPTPVVAFNW